MKQRKKDFALNLVWCRCCHSFAKVSHFLYSWGLILQVMHPFFDHNNLLLPFRASAIILFFRLLFIATGVTFTFRCRHWRSPLFCHACLWSCSNPTTLPAWLSCCSIHKMLLNLLLMWSFPPTTNATISKYSQLLLDWLFVVCKEFGQSTQHICFKAPNCWPMLYHTYIDIIVQVICDRYKLHCCANNVWKI